MSLFWIAFTIVILFLALKTLDNMFKERAEVRRRNEANYLPSSTDTPQQLEGKKKVRDWTLETIKRGYYTESVFKADGSTAKYMIRIPANADIEMVQKMVDQTADPLIAEKI